MADPRHYEMKCFFNQKCLVYPILFMTQENLMNLHYVWYDQKIAINYHVESKCLPFTKEPSEMQKLNAKMMRTLGWEVLDLSEKEYKSWVT